VIICGSVTDGGATDDSVSEIGVDVGGGCSTTSHFSGTPFRFDDTAGGISST
jgi:hypothetical protein